MGLFDRFRKTGVADPIAEAMEEAISSEQSAKERLKEIGASLAVLKAHEQDAAGKLQAAQEEIQKLTGYIEKRVAEGDEETAKDLIRQKLQLEEQLPQLQKRAEETAANLKTLLETQDEIRREYGTIQ
ncbi:MAG: hypothetical protein K6G23_02535 [Lachnospiraceae bacterium]|nr:hypothetical protein [Lachnospiraceae bacterium]